MMDDDDDFLYGTSVAKTAPPPTTSAAPKPIPVEQTELQTTAATNGGAGVVAHLEGQAQQQATEDELPGLGGASGSQRQVSEEQEEEEVVEEEEDSEDDDIEIVTEAPARSIDFRQNRPPTTRVASTMLNVPTQPRAQALQAALTTEYTPIARGAPAPSSSGASLPGLGTSQTPASATTTSTTQQPSTTSPDTQQQQQQTQPQTASDAAATQAPAADAGPDPNTLPPVKAPPSHPKIDPSETGVYSGQDILDLDLSALADKPWRRPGSDISDWFNYGFDEISWEAYCYRRRDVGDMAHVLKANVLNFAAMTEEQVTALPGEVRGMVMASANTMMNQAQQQAMMGVGPGVMDMSGMGGMMGVGGMGGMGIDMNTMMMQQQQGPGQGQDMGQGQGQGQGMMQDGFGQGDGMMGMGMGDYGMQDQGQMVAGMYQGMDVSQGNINPNVQGSGRGTPLNASGGPGGAGGYRNAPRVPSGAGGVGAGGAAGNVPPAMRGGRGGYAGRGRGTRYDAPPAPVRPASPLPPNVPTGPRNQNKYKDRDNNAPAVEGLDYGGGGGGRRTPSHEPEDRGSRYDRKRRPSPGMDDGRSSKRR